MKLKAIWNIVQGNPTAYKVNLHNKDLNVRAVDCEYKRPTYSLWVREGLDSRYLANLNRGSIIDVRRVEGGRPDDIKNGEFVFTLLIFDL